MPAAIWFPGISASACARSSVAPGFSRPMIAIVLPIRSGPGVKENG